MIVSDTAMEADVGLDCWPTEMPIEDRLRRLQAHALVDAIEQASEPLDLVRR